MSTKSKTPTVTFGNKKIPVFPFQEDFARRIARSLVSGKGMYLGIPTGWGRRVIMRRAADLFNPKKLKELYANKEKH